MEYRGPFPTAPEGENSGLHFDIEFPSGVIPIEDFQVSLTIAQQISTAPDPYRKAIASMVYRIKDADASTVTMHFEDSSSLMFKISYAVVSVAEPACTDRSHDSL